MNHAPTAFTARLQQSYEEERGIVEVAIHCIRIAHLTHYLCNFKRKEWCKGGEIRNFFSIFVGK